MRILLTFAALLALNVPGRAASTINSTNAYSYGANIGWMNWRPSAADGVSIGEYICTGYIYGANVGWINMGNGFVPSNGHVQYTNTSATDFGVNYIIASDMPGKAFLRGYAYGANIGWINFDAPDNPFPVGTLKPQVSFFTGKLSGYAYSANCGWINLGDGTFAVQTDSIAPGVDSDSDGMADAFEFQNFGNLSMNASTDSDGDGMSDMEEYLEGTDPLQAGDRLRIITLVNTVPANTSTQIQWASNVSRLYAIDTTLDLGNLVTPPTWTDLGIDGAPNAIVPSVGLSTTRTVITASAAKRFFRVRAIRPLVP